MYYPFDELLNHAIPLSSLIFPAIRAVLYQFDGVLESEYFCDLVDQVHDIALVLDVRVLVGSLFLLFLHTIGVSLLDIKYE